MITLADYMMGRDVTHALECTPDILCTARRTVEIVNKLLVLAKVSGVPLDGLTVTSGWRPPSINARTRGASRTSLHMSGDACDLSDPTGALDRWCAQESGSVLRDLGLWLESPAATPKWCHVQTRPPRSGARIFNP